MIHIRPASGAEEISTMRRVRDQLISFLIRFHTANCAFSPAAKQLELIRRWRRTVRCRTQKYFGFGTDSWDLAIFKKKFLPSSFRNKQHPPVWLCRKKKQGRNGEKDLKTFLNSMRKNSTGNMSVVCSHGRWWSTTKVSSFPYDESIAKGNVCRMSITCTRTWNRLRGRVKHTFYYSIGILWEPDFLLDFVNISNISLKLGLETFPRTAVFWGLQKYTSHFEHKDFENFFKCKRLVLTY